MTLDEFTYQAIGVPFVEHGRDFDGWDCWGLVVTAYREVLGLNVPDYTYDGVSNYRALARNFEDRGASHWRQVEPKPLTVALIYRRGLVIHAGLVLPKSRILHVEKGIATCHQPMRDFRFEGFYAPSSQAAPV